MQNKGLTVLSYGLGQDSTAILFKILHDPEFRAKYVRGKLIVVTANTKNEHDESYEYARYVRPQLEAAGIEFYMLNNWATGKWKHGLVGFYRATNTVGSKAFPKTCTDRLKIKPIYNFLEQYLHTQYGTKSNRLKKGFYEFMEEHGKVRVLLGIAEGEEFRASANGESKSVWFNECVEKVYPLIEEGMDRQGCQDYIASLNEPVPPPSNCIFCHFLSYQELLYMYRYQRDRFDEWVELEANKLAANTHASRNLGVWGKEETLLETVQVAITKYGHMTKEELEEYKFSHGHCVRSKY